ncbi:G2/mitotic-specific cyclin-B1 [Falco biarmicus]|uniref:G2/mitotic-specific cyclin-B1 n=1 Tax=Falco rusticolus TaxID=120794 RepID=UPI0018867856|nr:G2/mitotic-specific cyclin-B1 [Falco rusticolus]XP_055555664.1 G2/mitotic-specific cyclin-B1 [Falco cherrug]XP_056181458.1 G2/mitotic-specific cyclin-B1 [Falco biarmicus]
MRAVLVDWLVQVQLKLKLQQETLYMAAGITDCFLQVNLEQHILAKYLMELSIVDYEMTSALQYHMSYNEEDLLAVGQCTARNVMLMNVGLTKQMAIKNKYASCINYKMSTVGQLDSSIIPNLDQPLI